MTFLELAQRVLDEHIQPLTPIALWEQAKRLGYDSQLGSTGKTPWATLAAQLYVSVKDNAKSPFDVVPTRPKRFFLKKHRQQIDLAAFENADPDEEVTTITPAKPKKGYLERDLHPLLTYYAKLYMQCYTKTIDHSKSSKRSYGEWVHPDMVGVVFPIEDWEPNVLELSSTLGNISTKLISFELKRSLSLGNLRESFFQTVSNSSWANEAYLVAADISVDADFQSELKRLSTSFGVGIIRLDTAEPNSSEILLPANERESLDWETMNKLAEMNDDFRQFLKRIKTDIHSREIRKEKYDKVRSDEELVMLLN